MIETLYKKEAKDNEGVEIKYQDLSILAAKTPEGYVVMVFDKDGDVLDEQVYKMKI